MRTTAVYKDKRFLDHNPGKTHPETPKRLEKIYQVLEQKDVSRHFLFPSFSPLSEDILLYNHSQTMIDEVALTAGKTAVYLSGDTRTSALSYETSLLAAGAVIDGVRRVCDGEADNAFCLVRPPGHHAEKHKSMGFCLFNNIALAAHYCLRRLGLKKILIVDWDLHHGNGTQKSFYNSAQVLFCSLHQYPQYPGTGSIEEIGQGDGKGYTINIPLKGGFGDAAYGKIFEEIVTPVAFQYQPDIILVSCGFDIYQGDPLGIMRVTSAGFAYMTRKLVNIAEQICNGKVLITLEGGYNMEAMHHGSLAVLQELYGSPIPGIAPYLTDETVIQSRLSDSNVDILPHLKNILGQYWTFQDSNV
ncbi:histone deacetylase family protein [Desulfogranum japonicum]|uniref:histone deacetylase family protein n=1 Tax=Desulfogranum japonicum TaxID=231447 RepID=UPI0004290BDD|nr:histone deacetylase [Desulfogranum japonicum]